MIWNNLKQSDIQRFIGVDLLNRLETLLPLISGGKHDSYSIYQQSNLIKIFNAFVTIQFFKNKENLKMLLNSIQEQKLNSLLSLCHIEASGKSFPQKVDSILKQGWKNR